MTSANNSADWVPSKYGREDRIGAANNITEDSILTAAAYVKEGRALALGIVTGADTPTFAPRTCQVVITPSTGPAASVRGQNGLCGNDDLLITHCGMGTHMDALGHVGIDHTYYNGLKSEDIIARDGVKELGAENIPPIVGRGVLLDMTKALNEDPVAPGRAFNSEEIKRASDRQQIEIRPGDIVLFHTNWMSIAHQEPERYIRMSPGLGEDGAQYLADAGVVAIGADNAALEVMPFEDPAKSYPVHEILLPRSGVYLLENVNTRELASLCIHEFLLVIAQPRFKGCVQIPVNPVAIY